MMVSWKAEYLAMEEKYVQLLDQFKSEAALKCEKDHLEDFDKESVIPAHGVAIKFVNKTRPYFLSSKSSFGFDEAVKGAQVADVVGIKDTLDQEVLDEL